MRVTTRISWSMLTGEVLEHDWYDYAGPVAECKGEGTSKDQLAKQNALQQQAFDAQMQRFNELRTSFAPYMQGAGIGYDPALKAALQSQFQNQTADQYGQARTGINSAILARGGGGQGPVSGSDIRGIMGLEAAKANTLSQGTLGLGINDLQQALQNKFQSGNIMSGNAAALSAPVSTFGAGASNALNQYMQAANSGFGARFMSALGGSLGKGLGQMGTGFVGGFLKPPGEGG